MSAKGGERNKNKHEAEEVESTCEKFDSRVCRVEPGVLGRAHGRADPAFKFKFKFKFK